MHDPTPFPHCVPTILLISRYIWTPVMWIHLDPIFVHVTPSICNALSYIARSAFTFGPLNFSNCVFTNRFSHIGSESHDVFSRTPYADTAEVKYWPENATVSVDMHPHVLIDSSGFVDGAAYANARLCSTIDEIELEMVLSELYMDTEDGVLLSMVYVAPLSTNARKGPVTGHTDSTIFTPTWFQH